VTRYRAIFGALAGLLILTVGGIAALHVRTSRILARFTRESRPELAFMGGMLSGVCVLAEAAETAQALAPVTRRLDAASAGNPPASHIRGALDAFGSLSRRVRQVPLSKSDDDPGAARRRAVALTDETLAILAALPDYDSASRALKSNAIALAEKWKQVAGRDVYDAQAVTQLESDLGRLGDDVGAVIRAMFVGRLQTDLSIVSVYIIVFCHGVPVVSTVAKDLLSSLIRETDLDVALRGSRSFDSVRSAGCLSASPVLLDAVLSLADREMGVGWIARLARERSGEED
jgi:hypothetical protein